MLEVELHSWFFVYKEWGRLNKMPTVDKGFEESFRDYLYRKINFDSMSNKREMGFGASYSTLSSIPHELDVICTKEKSKFVFELKNYEVTNITKEMIFTFLGKVIDFYFKNAETLSDYRINMFFITTNKNVDDSIRKLCIAFGIKLIEPSLMTLKIMNHFSRDLYCKIPEDDETKSHVEKLIDSINSLQEKYDFSFSDIFRYVNSKIDMDLQFSDINVIEALKSIHDCYNAFEKVRLQWKS